MTSDIDLQRAIFASFQQQIFHQAQRHFQSASASFARSSNFASTAAGPRQSRSSPRRSYSESFSYSRHVTDAPSHSSSRNQKYVAASASNHRRSGNGRVSTLAKEGISAIPTSGTSKAALRYSQEGSSFSSYKNTRIEKQRSGALGRKQWDVQLEEPKRRKPDLLNRVNRNYTFEEIDEDDDSRSTNSSIRRSPQRTHSDKRRSQRKKISTSLNHPPSTVPSSTASSKVIYTDSAWLGPWMEKVGRGTIQRHHDKGVFVLESSSSQKPFVVCFQEDALEDLFSSAQYNMQCRFKMMKSSDQQTCGFIVNYKSISRSKCSYVAFVFSAISKLWTVEKHQGDRKVVLAQASAENYYKPGKWNQISLEVRGSSCTLFLNDRPMFENVAVCNDENKIDGKIGISVRMTKTALKSWQIKDEAIVGSADSSDHVNRSLPVGIDRALADQIRQDIILKDLNVTWDDIAELGDAKSLLQEAVVLPMIIPECFNGLRKPWGGVLLYGPPGTGKTMLAKAVSSQARSTFFNVSASSVVSKFHGESEKMIRTLFEMARHFAPSVIFMDEIDSITGRRGSSTEHEASRRLKSELLSQMDGINSDEKKQVLVLATTNRPWDLDPAIIRRLEKRIYVPLPDLEARKVCFEIFLKDLDENRELDYDALAQKSEGYSGADIKVLCRDASMIPMRRALEGKGVDEILEMKQNGELHQFNISQEDFSEAFKKVRPSVAQDDFSKYQSWSSEFGSL